MSDSLYKALPDSLRPQTRQLVTDQSRMRIIQNTSPAFVYRFHDEIKAMALQLEEGIETVKSNEDKIPYAQAIAGFYIQTGNLTQELYWFKKLMTYGIEEKVHRSILTNAYLNVAMIYAFHEKQDSAVGLLHKAANIAIADHDSATLLSTYYVYIPIYKKLQLYRRAIEYANKYLRGLPVSEKWSQTYTESMMTKANLYGLLYRDEQKPAYADSTKALIKEVMVATRKDEAYWYRNCYVTLGLLYYFMGDYKTALHYYDLSMLPKYNQAGSYMAEIVYKEKLYRSLCLIRMGKGGSLQEALSIIIPPKDYAARQELNKVLAQYYTQRNDYKNALAYYTTYQLYADSSDVIGQKGKVFEAEQKYSVSQKEAAIAQLENKSLQAQATRNKIVLAGIILLLLLAILALLLYLRNKRQQVQRMAEQQKMVDDLHTMELEMERDRFRQQVEKEQAIIGQRQAISRNLHDELSSDLAAVYYFIGDLKGKAKTDEAQKLLTDVEDEVLTVYEQSRDFTHRLSEGDPLENYSVFQLLENLSLRFSMNSGLRIHTQVDSSLVQKMTAKQNSELYKVVKEAVTNCLKHSGANYLDIQLHEQGELIMFDIRDNGRGIILESGKGLGLNTMRERIEGLGGNLEINPLASGLHIYGSFPKLSWAV